MPTFFYTAARSLSIPLLHGIWRPRVSGVENVPREGGFIVASNHLAYIDSAIIPIAIPRPVHFVAKDDLWQKKGPVGRATAWFFEQVGAVPVDRAAIASGKGALQAGLEILRRGDGFGIYPEGGRSKDGLLHPGKQGAAWLALESGCPVIPVGLKGTPHFRPDGILPERRAISVRIGAPIDFSDLDPGLSKGLRRREMTTRIMDEIQKLSGQRRSPATHREPKP